MSKSVLRQTALFMLVIFLTSLVVFGFNGARLAHQIDHVGKIELPASEHEHGRVAGDSASSEDASDATAHQVLHAVDHVQLFPNVETTSAVVASVASIMPTHFADHLLPLPGFDLPFRPPRNTTLPA